MIKTKRGMQIALAVPILALGSLVAYKAAILSLGEKVILPIYGYDPRDLLSGHYLTYRIDYGVEDLCSPKPDQKSVAYICMSSKKFSFAMPQDCKLMIRGLCNGERFEAGIERYFVPEDKAKELEQRIRTKRAGIELSITSDGHVQVHDLLIDGKSWTTD